MKRRESAGAISDLAAQWVVRVDRGLSAAEQVALEAWIAADRHHQGAFARAQALWLQSDRTRIYRDVPEVRAAQSARRRWPPWAVAAGLILALGAAITGWHSYAQTHFATAIGEIRHVPLPDGSSVTLDTGSQIAVSYSRGLRLVRLDRGEALFDVAHDPSRPFVVEAGALRVRAVGTAFLVRRTQRSEAEVTVTRGVVDVWRDSSVPEPSVRLTAGLHTAATSTVLEPIQSLSEGQVAQATAWEEGAIDLEGRTLGEAAAEFNRYNVQRLVVEEPALAHQRVVGRFSLNDPLGFAHAAAAMLGAHVRSDEGRIVLESGPGK